MFDRGHSANFDKGFIVTITPENKISCSWSLTGELWDGTLTSTIACEQNVWYHVCVERLNDLISLYINGIEEGSSELLENEPLATNYGVLAYGAFKDTLTSVFNGSMILNRITISRALYRHNFIPPFIYT